MFELRYLLKYLIMKNVEKKLLKGNQAYLHFFSHKAAKQYTKFPKLKQIAFFGCFYSFSEGFYNAFYLLILPRSRFVSSNQNVKIFLVSV